MEDITTLIWLGIAIIWFVTRLIRRGARKVARSQKQRSRPQSTSPSTAPTQAPPIRTSSQPDFSGRGGTGPPPIVPR